MMRMVGSPLNHPSITLQLQSNHFSSSPGQVFFGFVLLWTFIFICKVLLEIVLQVIVFWKYCCLKLAASFVNDSCYWAEKGHYRPRGMSPLLNHWFSTTLDIFVNTLIIVMWWLMWQKFYGAEWRCWRGWPPWEMPCLQCNLCSATFFKCTPPPSPLMLALQTVLQYYHHHQHHNQVGPLHRIHQWSIWNP